MEFMNNDFLLKTETAKKLYHDHAAKMPIIDYHCHINPADIAENKRYSSISEVWLYGDHYKWRLIRANGTKETDITGARESDPYKMFERFAEALPRAIGNPVFHWTYLELKRYFGIEGLLTPETTKEIYDECNKKLKESNMDVRGLIDQSNVRLICTTDDPIDSLEYHKKIADDTSCSVKVLPAFRPDKAVNIDAYGFKEYIALLSDASGININDFSSLCAALENRIDFFHSMGCRASDHALDGAIYSRTTTDELNRILRKALNEDSISADDAAKYRTEVLLFVGRCYSKRNWVMQIHFGCMRNNNKRMFDSLGPDTGFDSMNGQGSPANLNKFLNALDETNELPKTILYSLNPADSEVIATIAGCFMADSGCNGKVQLGAAWWFNDTKSGMEKHLLDYSNSTLLANFVGMLTDSRSFLSYTRHEYFRRILCNFIGQLVEDGEYPASMEQLGQMVEDICYNNTVKFFGFNEFLKG